MIFSEVDVPRASHHARTTRLSSPERPPFLRDPRSSVVFGRVAMLDELIGFASTGAGFGEDTALFDTLLEGLSVSVG